MVGITLEQAQSQLDHWLAASAKIAEMGQSVSHADGANSDRLDRVNAADALAQVKYWRSEVARLSRAGGIQSHRMRVCG